MFQSVIVRLNKKTIIMFYIPDNSAQTLFFRKSITSHDVYKTIISESWQVKLDNFVVIK